VIVDRKKIDAVVLSSIGANAVENILIRARVSRELCERIDSRVIDRSLQRLRKSGVIEFGRGVHVSGYYGWRRKAGG